MPWYVLYTKPRQEKKTADALQRLGFTIYCPLVAVVKQWSDRKKKVQIPLINSYVFVNIEEHKRDQVFQVSGIVRYLFWLGKPAEVRDIEIDVLKQSLDGAINSFEVKPLQENEIISVPTGPFQGVEGIIKHINNNTIQLVLVDLGFYITIRKE